MQGRITKVLNMKPPEILSMLEEAAGTRMYEAKKEIALKTLEKKQSKVDEIDKLLDQEILPALEKLRRERMQYMQWANGNAELERLRRFCVAYDYAQAEKFREDGDGKIEEMKRRILDLDASDKVTGFEIQGMEEKISALTVQKEAKIGGEVKKMSDKVDALSRVLVRETSVLNNKEESVTTEKRAEEKVLHLSVSQFILYFSVVI